MEQNGCVGHTEGPAAWGPWRWDEGGDKVGWEGGIEALGD